MRSDLLEFLQTLLLQKMAGHTRGVFDHFLRYFFRQ